MIADPRARWPPRQPPPWTTMWGGTQYHQRDPLKCTCATNLWANLGPPMNMQFRQDNPGKRRKKKICRPEQRRSSCYIYSMLWSVIGMHVCLPHMCWQDLGWRSESSQCLNANQAISEERWGVYILGQCMKHSWAKPTQGPWLHYENTVPIADTQSPASFKDGHGARNPCLVQPFFVLTPLSLYWHRVVLLYCRERWGQILGWSSSHHWVKRHHFRVAISKQGGKKCDSNKCF